MKWTSRFCWIAATLAASASLALAQPPEGSLRVARLVKTLGSDQYGARRAADLELHRLGAEGRAQLEAAAQSPDPEIRLRALHLLERLTVTQLWEPTFVTLDVTDATLPDVLAQCENQTGNHLFAGATHGEFTDKPLTYRAEKRPYWCVLDDLARLTDNRFRTHYDTHSPGIVFIAGKPGAFPTAYSGPVRSQLTSARRTFVEDLDYEHATSEVAHRLQLNVQMTWEDRFRLVAYGCQPEIVEAITNTGVAVNAPHSDFAGWNVASPGTRQISAELKLNPPPTGATGFSVLRLRWSLIALGDMAVVELEQPRAGGELHADGISVRVTAFDAQQSGRVEVTLVVARALPVPDPADILFQENTIELLGANGIAFQQQSQQHSLTDRGVEFKLAFMADRSTATPAKLRIAYPKLRSHRDLDIVFRDVPLPSQMPQ